MSHFIGSRIARKSKYERISLGFRDLRVLPIDKCQIIYCYQRYETCLWHAVYILLTYAQSLSPF